jgi:peptidoglycan-associated lipoprotein
MQRIFYFLLAVVFIGSCTYTQKIKDGTTAFERKQYKEAIPMLQKEYNKLDSRREQGNYAFMMAESYRELGQVEAAIQWYKTAYDYSYGVDALKQQAYMLKQNEQYEEAKQAFKNLGIEIGSPYEYRKEIAACDIAIAWDKDPNLEYSVEGADFNTGQADYSPTLYENNQLVFTSDRGSSTGEDLYNWTGNKYSDLFIVDLNSEIVRPFDGNINSEYNDGTAVFTGNYSEMYFTRCYSGEKYEDNFCKLMMSQRSGDSWTVPVVLPFVKDRVNYGHPAMSANGNSLYFSSNDPEGWGGFDLYLSERTPDGWSEPVLLSRSINTIHDEQFPFLDGDTLYFASSGHTGMGGLDIFKTYRMENSYWSSPFNLKPPINSGGDDFGFTLIPLSNTNPDIQQEGYFSSNRVNGIGNDDIYRFIKQPPAEEIVPTPEPLAYTMRLEGYVLEKIYAVPDDPNSDVLGRKPLNQATVDITIGRSKKQVTVGEDGFFSLELDEKTNYEFFASKEGYFNNVERFSTEGIGKDPNNPDRVFELEIVLDKIFRNKEITLENIYYDFDKWDIREDAEPTLDQLADDLNLNPDLRIELGSHTDCRGNARYNEDLSQKRAQSAVDFLISKGVDAGRLVATGYGENVPQVDCVCNRCSEDQHQANRRTTFKIIE